jgi:hypothetical protein
MQGASQTHRYELGRATQIAGIASIASFVVSLIGFFAAGIWGDDTEPYNDPPIGVLAWDTFLIAGATAVVLVVVFVVLANLGESRSRRTSASAAKER